MFLLEYSYKTKNVVYTFYRVYNTTKESIMYKKLIWTVALVFSFMLAQSAFAASSCGQGLRTMVESLKLDDSQKEKVKPILEQLRTTMKDTHSQMKDIQSKIHQQVVSPTMDQNTVTSLVDQQTKLIG